MATDSLLTRLLAVLCLLLATTLTSARDQLLDRIVAVVNDDVILESELDESLADVRARLEKMGAPEMPEAELRKQALERLILRRLQLQEAKRLGLDVNDAMLRQAMETIAKRNGLTLEEMQKAIAEQGMTPEAYRRQLREEILLQRLHNREVLNRIQVSKAEVDDYLANQAPPGDTQLSYHLHHILIPTPEGASAEEIAKARRLAESIIDKLKKGEDFATLAVQYSKGRQALDGGDLGWLEAGKVPTLFARELVDMKKGEVRGPLQSSSGFHIIRLDDVKGKKRQLVQQTHVRHILARTDEKTSDEEARIRMEQIYQRIKGGEDFAALARAHSDDKASAIKGGDLGWVDPGSLVPKFEEVMNSLQEGELSKPFRTQFGWHIVQVLGRREKDVTDQHQRDLARKAIRNRKAEEALQLYLRKLRGQAYVETRLNDQP